MHRLATIGYEDATLKTLVDTLVASGIGAVVDVRAIANSRRPGFSKRLLSASLNGSGIQYHHLPALGTPAEGREAARNGETARMRTIFETRLHTPEAQGALIELAGLAEQTPCCLICLEANPHDCHRLMITDAMQQKFGVSVHHLYLGGGWAPLPKQKRTCRPF